MHKEPKMLNERHRHRRIPATPLSVALGLALAVSGPALAQDDDTATEGKAKTNATELARVQVTGSNIRRSDVETASPVQVIDAKQIENMGARTLLQVLDNLPAARPAQQDSARCSPAPTAARRPTCAAWVRRARWCC
jgi:iron complex outermembrane receptor protein